MILRNKEIGITVRAVPTAAPPDGDTPYGRDMRTPQQTVDDPEMGYTGFQFVLLTELIDDPAPDSEWAGSPIHDEILNAVASNCDVDNAVPQPVLAFTTTKGRIVLEFGDFGEVFEVDQRPSPVTKNRITWRRAIEIVRECYNDRQENGSLTDEEHGACEAVVGLAGGFEEEDLDAAVTDTAEYNEDGTLAECDHEHSHLNNPVTGHRFCNDCQQEFIPIDYTGPHLTRWKFVDETTYLWADGASQEFVRQVWAMLDTRSLDDLKVLGGPNFGRS